MLETINNLKSKYEVLAKVKIDLVYNSIKEINSKKIIRRNRGILFTHEIKVDYFPLFKNFKIKNSNSKSLSKDILSMYYSSIYYARKTILNYDYKSDERKLNIKNFIYNCKNYLYFEGFNASTVNDALKFFKEHNLSIFNALQNSIEIKKSNYEALPENYDTKLVKLTEKLFSKHLHKAKNDWYFEDAQKPHKELE